MLQAKPKIIAQQPVYKDFKYTKSSKSFNPINTLFGNQQTPILQNNLAIPLYKGHFINFHHEEIQFDNSITLSGIQEGFLYFVFNSRYLRFYFYSPTQADLNYYYNTDDKKYKFPLRMKEQQINHTEYISAVAFQCQDNQWTMAIASEFYIFLYTFNGDLENFQMLKKGFNINGEIVNQILFYQENLIYGGNLGYLTCKSIDTAQNYTSQLKERIKKQFNRIFKDFTPWTSTQGLIQLKVQEEFNICYGLFEQYDQEDKVCDTYVVIYDISLKEQQFTEIVRIKQSNVYNFNAELKNTFDLDNLQFQHIHFEKQWHTNNILMIITTKDQLQIYFTFEVQDRCINDVNLYQSRIINSNKSQDSIKLKSEYSIFQIKYPYMKFDQEIPYGVCLDESRTQYKQKEMLSIQQKHLLKSVFRDDHIALYHLDNYIIAQFIDMAHIQYIKNLEQQLSKYNSYNQLQYSLYRDSSKEAVENIELHSVKQNQEFPENLYNLGRYSIKQIFNHSDINESQLYNLPEHYICIADHTIEFIVRMRPIDFFFTAIKVTHYDFINQAYEDFPLEKLIRAYGIEESCAQILQIIIQEDSIFYINVELQHQYQLDLQKAYQRIHFSENIDKFFDDNEKIPIWVTGQVYVTKGSTIKDKAMKAYFSLIKRSLLSEDRNQKSKKVFSTSQLIWKILAPLTTKKFIDEKVYNLECNQPIESYSIQQLQMVYKQIEKLLKLFENEPNYFQKRKQQIVESSQEEQIQQLNYKKGFNKHIYESFELSSKLDNSRSTNYSDQSLVQSVNVDIEHTQMKGLYDFCLQIKQLIQFFVYFFGDLNGIRNIINSYSNKQQLFDLSVKTILNAEPSSLLTLKQLMIHIIKSDKSKFRDMAQYMHVNFSEYFTIQDFKISLAQNLFDEILQFAAQKNIIKLNPNEQIHEKIKRILRLSKAPQITFEKVLEKREIFIYYKELQAELQEQLKEALKSVEEVIFAISHSYLTQSFLNYMFPFGTFKYYIQFLASKCQQYEKDQFNDEHRICFLDLIQQYNNLIQYYLDPPKGLTKAQVYDILRDSLQILNQYQLITATEVVINNLIKQKLKEFIAYIDYNQDLELQCNELEKLQIQKKQLLVKSVKGDNEAVYQLIQLLLKLAQFSLVQNSEMTLEDIQKVLPLRKRLRYIFKAQEFIKSTQKNELPNDILQFEKQAQDLSKILFLQDIMYDYIVTNNNEDYLSQKRRILIEILDCNIIMQFFEDNNICFGQILCMDYLEQKQQKQLYNEFFIDQVWTNFIVYSYQESREWPSKIFKMQMKLVLENLINKDKYIRIQKITETFELVNSKECQEQKITQLSTWFFFEVLLNHNISEMELTSIYVNNLINNVMVQDNPAYERLQIDELHLYKLQLIQQILILFNTIKKNKYDRTQFSELLTQFRNAFKNEYNQFIDDDVYDQTIIEDLKKQIDSL
ncbi:unnamed protein product [Paramecium pentaurelia]|uniref:Uncharacterized protein n=1 Tax=Paramecium pentaurelia TaxID=43138 RepID=A0A8S1UTA4_9CILI|nr:unnamed protein product [Paramecium pentaurelia]